MNKIREFIAKQKEIVGRVEKGPYRVERIDHEDTITYEVSSPEKLFHVVFSEWECLDQKINARTQAEFYAEARNNYEALLEALSVAVTDLEDHECNDHWEDRDLPEEKFHPCTKCEELTEIEKLLEGKR